MIDLYYWTTPNGHKVTMFLEEAGVEYRLVPINIGKGEQFKPEFLRIAPNNRIPAMVDTKPADGGAPVSVFESGAILLYLAEKTGKFLPKTLRGRAAADGGAEPSFQQLRAREAPLRDRPLRQGDQPALRCPEPAPCPPRLPRR